MELVAGKTYKIKRVRGVYTGERNKDGSWKTKRKTTWITGVYMGIFYGEAVFDIGNDREVGIHVSNIEDTVKEY